MQKIAFIGILGALAAIGCGSSSDRMGESNGIKGPPDGEWQAGRTIELPGGLSNQVIGDATNELGNASVACSAGTPVLTRGVSLSTSLASAAVARESLRDAKAPLPTTLRPQDFANYYHFPVALSDNPEGGPRVSIELRKRNPTAFKGLVDAVVVVYAPPVADRLPVTLSVVVDTSKSMSGTGISRARAVVSALGTNLKAGDRVWLLTTRQAFFDEPAQLFEIGAFDAPDLALAAKTLDIESDVESGAPYLYRSAYLLAQANFDPARLNRIFLISDGEGSDGDLDAVYMRDAAALDLRPVGVGVGQAPADLLRTASRFGAGRYIYVDSLDEANAISSSRFDELTGVAYRHVSLELTYPDLLRAIGDGKLVIDPESVEPQHLAPGGSMVFPYLFVACDPAIVDTITIDATVSYEDAGGSSGSVPASGTFSTAGPSPLFDKVMAVESYTDALLSLDHVRFDKAFVAIDNACLSAPSADPEITELHDLISAHPVFAASPPTTPALCNY